MRASSASGTSRPTNQQSQIGGNSTSAANGAKHHRLRQLAVYPTPSTRLSRPSPRASREGARSFPMMRCIHVRFESSRPPSQGPGPRATSALRSGTPALPAPRGSSSRTEGAPPFVGHPTGVGTAPVRPRPAGSRRGRRRSCQAPPPRRPPPEQNVPAPGSPRERSFSRSSSITQFLAVSARIWRADSAGAGCLLSRSVEVRAPHCPAPCFPISAISRNLGAIEAQCFAGDGDGAP